MRASPVLLLLLLHVAFGQVELFDGDLDGQPIAYRVANGFAVYQDDILLGPAEKPSGQRASSFYTGNLWTGGLVPYEIDSTAPPATQVRLQQAIDTWNGYGTPIHLQQRGSEPDYIRFVKPTALAGDCNSFVGRRGGAQIINLEDFCSVATIIHEIGHAVGFWHEQSRADRNRNVTVLYENIAKDRANNYRVESLGQNLGGYEYSSSMHYSPLSFGDGRQTMESVPPGIPMGEAAGMNAGDLDAVSRKYGLIPTQTTVSSNPMGLVVEVDGEAVITPRVFAWEPGSRHSVSVPEAPQSIAGTRYVYGKWSDGGAQNHELEASASLTVYTANFVRQMPVIITQQNGGSVSVDPPSPDGYYLPFSQITVTAEPNNGFRFYRWSPAASFSCNPLTTSANPIVLRPRTNGGYGCTPIYTQGVITTITSDPPGQIVTVDGATYMTPINFLFASGSQHTLAASTPAAGYASRLRFVEWSNGGAATQTYTAKSNGDTVTARFSRQYLLTLQQPPASLGLGRIVANPASADGFYDEGTSVSLQADIPPPFSFMWNGDLFGATNPNAITMDDQHLVGYSLGVGQPPFMVFNALTFQAAPISPGQIVSLFGADLGPPAAVGPTMDASGRVATESGGTRVLFDGVPAPVLYASSGQVNVVVPYGVTGRSSTRIVSEYQGVPRPQVSMPVVPLSPSIVSNGAGKAVIVNEDGSFNSADRPAKRGSVIVFFASGEGMTTPAGVDGRIGFAPLAKPVEPVSVRIGGRPADVLYAGNAPNFVAGAMQVNARISNETPKGEVSIYLVVGDAASPALMKMFVE